MKTTNLSKVDNRLTRLFARDNHKLLNIFLTAGYPEKESLATLLPALEAAGADLLEIGIPFSDPLADGPVIQASSQKALENGMNLELLFSQLEKIKIGIPRLLMGYFNPVLQFGVEKFCARCEAVGIDGLILPDLPMDLYERKYQQLFTRHNLSNIFLITPQTSSARIRKIDELSNGFIYAVSSSSTTGNQQKQENGAAYLEKVAGMELKTPILTGFNIRDKASFELATRFTQGGIIGSAYIRALENADDPVSATHTFIQSIKNDAK